MILFYVYSCSSLIINFLWPLQLVPFFKLFVCAITFVYIIIYLSLLEICHILYLVDLKFYCELILAWAVRVANHCFSSSDMFLFCWTAFLSISLLASVFPVSLPLFSLSSALAWFMRECLTGVGLCAWTHFIAFMEWADEIGSRPYVWSYVPVQFYSYSLRVFYRT